MAKLTHLHSSPAHIVGCPDAIVCASLIAECIIQARCQESFAASTLNVV